MARQKSIIIMPKLQDHGGDLTKTWFVEYSCRNPRTDEMKRFRVYDGFKVLTTVAARYELAEKIINTERLKLERGITPFTEEVRSIIYEDDLMYDSAARIFGKKKSSIITIRTHLNEFLDKKQSEVIHHTYQTYKSKLRIFCMYMEMRKIDKTHISFITQEMICDFIIYIADNNNLSRRSIVKYEHILYNFFDYLLKVKKVIEKNPVHDIPKIGLQKDCAPHPINDRDRAILKKKMMQDDPQLWLVCQIEFYSAIRPGEEIRRMRIGDINFEAQTITIRKDIAKNRQTETVCFPNQLLKEFIKVHQLNEFPHDYYVFSKQGVPGPEILGKNNFRFRFDRIRDKLGLSKDYKLYSFKHTGAGKLAEKGVSTWELQRHMRHKSISTTENYVRRMVGGKSPQPDPVNSLLIDPC